MDFDDFKSAISRQAQIESLLDDLCTFYLTATPDERTAIRNLIQQQGEAAYSALYGYMRNMAGALRETQDAEILRKGLAAAAIEDMALDYRDTLTVLADLFVTAENAGIDPIPYFAEAAALSSTQPQDESMADTLVKFHTYAIVEERRKSR